MAQARSKTTGPGVADTAMMVFAAALVTILAALAFEHAGGYEPCPLCLQQRYAYYAGVPLAAIAYMLARSRQAGLARLALIAIAIGFAVNAALGVYHAGIEWHWWPGPSACAAGEVERAVSNILEQLSQTRVIRCDEAAWRLIGLSFAGWNAVISAGLAALAFAGARR